MGRALVRRVPSTSTAWHATQDDAIGTASGYGDATVPAASPTSAQAFNLAAYETFVDDDAPEYLFATGDYTKWVILDKSQLKGPTRAVGENTPVQLLSSHTSPYLPYTTNWYLRDAQQQDPLISSGTERGTMYQ